LPSGSFLSNGGTAVLILAWVTASKSQAIEHAMTKDATPAGTDDISAGTKGPTPHGGRTYPDRSSPPGPIKGGEAEKPGQMQRDGGKSK
jgi:hypothetical protein